MLPSQLLGRSLESMEGFYFQAALQIVPGMENSCWGFTFSGSKGNWHPQVKGRCCPQVVG